MTVPESETLASTADQREKKAIRQPYRTGPDQVKVRLVVFYDYQSPQCWRIEQDIQNLIAKYGDKMSVTARHYPLCSDCNFSVDANTHPNACRAALAAEAAGLLKGSEGFWQMHRWLFQFRGNFTDDELKQGLVKLGYDDTEQFLATMKSPPVLGGVLADIVEAQSLQIHDTPTVLFNGQKLAGLQAGTGLLNAMLAVSKKKNSSPAGSVQAPAPSSPIDLSGTDTFPESLQQTSLAATVRIVNTADRSVGSGAIIARDPFVYVLTAHHIVSDIKSVEVHTYSKESHPDPAGVYSHATVVANSESADLAVIRFSTRDPMPEPLPIVPLELEPQNLEPESRFPVLTVGYDDQDSAPRCIAAEVIDTKRVRRTAGDAAVTVWEVARESAPGRSGGPLIDQRGFVLGIASGIAEGKGYFTHTEEIHRFLKQNGLQGLLAPSNGGK
jgi:S1-C subfamily serine protease